MTHPNTPLKYIAAIFSVTAALLLGFASRLAVITLSEVTQGGKKINDFSVGAPGKI